MTSKLKVTDIADPTNGNTAISIDSSGIVTFPSNPVCIDQYRLTGNHTTNNGTLTSLEQVDDPYFSSVGTAMSVSSGIFSFPHTGVYRVYFFGNGVTNSGDSTGYVATSVSNDSGSTYDDMAYAIAGDSDGEQFILSSEVFVNVTNTSTFRLKFWAGSLSSGSAIHGDTDYNRTAMSFWRIADSQ